MAVTLRVEAPQPQRRATVAFRFILAIPHFLFGSLVLGSVALVVMVVAWFAALFTARVPHGVADALARILQYQARMYGYGQLLLTDRYPTFAIGPVDYAVEVEFDELGRFNRAAVLFRAILQLPALVVTQIVLAGLTPALVVIWLVTLVAGRMPDAAHMALASCLRYQMRTYAYVGLVTTEYPRGLFGDRPAPALDATAPGEADLAETAVVDELPATPHISRFVLSRASKNLIVLFLVLGTIFQGVNVVATVTSLSLGLEDAKALRDAEADLEDDVASWSAAAQSCAIAGGAECLGSAHANLAFAFDRFQRRVRAIDVSPSALDELDDLDRDVTEIRAILAELSAVNDRAEYQRLFLQLQDALFSFDASYEALYDAVLFS